MKKQQAFKRELKELLKKYDATIFATCEGDTYGIHSEQLLIQVKGDIKSGNHWPSFETIKTVKGWHLTYYDL